MDEFGDILYNPFLLKEVLVPPPSLPRKKNCPSLSSFLFRREGQKGAPGPRRWNFSLWLHRGIFSTQMMSPEIEGYISLYGRIFSLSVFENVLKEGRGFPFRFFFYFECRSRLEYGQRPLSLPLFFVILESTP